MIALRKKKTWVLVLVSIVTLVAVVGAVGYWAVEADSVNYELEVLHTLRLKSGQRATSSPSIVPNFSTSTATSTENITTGKLDEYTAETPAFPRGQKFILFFHADWCASCRALDQNIKENSDQIPAGLIIYKIDFDRFGPLKRKYEVENEHTLIYIDEAGASHKLPEAGSLKDLLVSIEG